MTSYRKLQENSYAANMMLYEKGLVIQTFGNVSVIDREKKVFAIKPSGVEYKSLRLEDIVVVDFENNIVEGELNPSSDTKTHTVLYKYFTNVGSVVHTHSPNAVAWAQAIKPIPVLGTTHADHLAYDIPCTDVMSDEMIKGNYEEETGNQIVETFKNISYEEIEMVLVACHGPFTWGRTADEAVSNSVILEELAKMARMTIQINPDVKRLKKSLIDKHYQRKHGKDSYYGQS
ncbi:MAG: L-ribulose-5-phosphate 4-epimerase AraD [Ignavibacteriaceae bacterium]